MKKLIDWLLATDEHRDPPITFLVFAVTFVGMLLALVAMPGW